MPKEVNKKANTKTDKKTKKDKYYVVVKTVVSNILGNTLYVLEATKCKTVHPSHLKAVAMIQNTIAKNKIGALPSKLKKQVKGGGHVMSPEYYGSDSGRYFDISEVSKLETHMFADSSLSRAELSLKSGGASVKNEVSASTVREAIREYNKSSNQCVKCSKEAFNMIHASVNENIKALNSSLSGGDVNEMSIKAAIDNNANLAHLRCNSCV